MQYEYETELKIQAHKFRCI